MSAYTEKLDALCQFALKNPGTAGSRAIKKIVLDLEGNGPIGELLHSTDENLFNAVIDILIEFRDTGRHEAFNSIHRAARERLV